VSVRRTSAIVAAVVFMTGASSAFASTARVRASDDVLVYRAAPGEVNDVQITEPGNGVTIVDTGGVISAGSGCSQVSDHEVTCSGAQAADIDLGDLGDTASLVVQDSVVFSLFGEEGSDVLTFCSQCGGGLIGGPGADTLQGGDLQSGLSGQGGPDAITGGAERDFIRGGAGTDNIGGGGRGDRIFPGGGDDLVDGGPGRDGLFFADSRPGVVVDLRLGTATGQGTKTLVEIEDVIGTNGPDRLYGDGGPNALSGVGGDDPPGRSGGARFPLWRR
jgi:Ca2+-binding RTX toxin-like protein